MDLLQTLLVYMSLVFATSVQTAPQPSVIPVTPDYSSAYAQETPTPTPPATPVPTINMTPNPAYKTLQVGDKGAEVRKMQEKLQEYGYYEGEIDGAYGNQSRRAVEEFQYMHGLTVDGIAGRHTLTVLYESNEIRPPRKDNSATPTPETQLALAITAPPATTPSPKPAGTPIPVWTSTPVPTHTPAPTAVPLPVEEMTGYTIVVNGTSIQAKAYHQGENVYLPVLSVLNAAGINVISSSSVEMDEYAFAAGQNLIRFTHTENQQGDPVDLQVYRNDEPQLVPDRSLYRAQDVLYMPAKSLESMTGLICTVEDTQNRISITGAEE